MSDLIEKMDIDKRQAYTYVDGYTFMHGYNVSIDECTEKVKKVLLKDYINIIKSYKNGGNKHKSKCYQRAFSIIKTWNHLFGQSEARKRKSLKDNEYTKDSFSIDKIEGKKFYTKPNTYSKNIIYYDKETGEIYDIFDDGETE